MASTYTTSLRLDKPAQGDLFGTWGTAVNVGITDMVDQAVAGRASVAMTDADYTLTSLNATSDEARNAVVRMTGTLTAARNVICPTVPKLYVFENATTGGFAVTLKTTAGTGVAVAAGGAAMLRCDGTNVVEWIPVTGTGSLVKAESPTLTGSLVINQAAADTEILSLKSSDVAHGITDYTETDTYGMAIKTSGATGGLSLWGFSESANGIHLNGAFTTVNTTKTSAGRAPVMLFASQKSGTGLVVPSADANLVAISDGTNARFLFDVEGDLHMPGSTATMVLGNGQIKFPASQNASADANTLDDYEEGTWTPVLTGWTNVGSPSLLGWYTKIGNLVTLGLTVTPATSVSSTAGFSGVSGFSAATGTPARNAVGGCANCSMATPLGQVCIFAGVDNLYLPTTGVINSMGTVDVTIQFRV